MNRNFTWAFLVLLTAAPLVRADGPDDAYVSIYALIQQADDLLAKGQTPAATIKYQEAQAALKRFQMGNPDWNPTIVKYRAKYVAEKITENAGKGTTTPVPVPAPAAPEAAKPAPEAVPMPATPVAPVMPAAPTGGDQATRLAAENALLQAKLKEALAAQPGTADPRELQKAQAAVDELRKENALLQVSLNEAKSAGVADAGKGAPNRQVVEAQTQVARLKADLESAKLETAALQARLKQTPAAPIAPVVVPANDVSGAERLHAAEMQIATLHARIEALESPRVPYTDEELALFKGSEAKLAAITAPAPKKSKPLPANATTLMAEAQRYFVGHQYDKARDKYLELLKMDDQNVGTLGNLALIELELNQYEPAEKHLRQALAADPNDAFCLGVLGRVKFQTGKYDEAQDLLSRAAQLDPKNAEVQNFLGITLDHKGLRSQAETALRKAVQIEPKYGAAHNNLAVAYVTQKPPLVELARYHYQKARDAGHPANPELEKLISQADKEAGTAPAK